MAYCARDWVELEALFMSVFKDTPFVSLKDTSQNTVLECVLWHAVQGKWVELEALFMRGKFCCRTK